MMIWSICGTTGSLAQQSCLCTGVFTQGDTEVKDALDIHKMHVISELLFSRMKMTWTKTF